MERLNPALPPEAITAAVDELTRDRSAMSLEAANREVYLLLKEGIKVSVPDREPSKVRPQKNRGALPHNFGYRRRVVASARCYQVSMQGKKPMGKEARSELVDALRERYRAAPREAKGRILDEFVAVSGFHRKHAVRLLRSQPRCNQARWRSGGGSTMRQSGRP